MQATLEERELYFCSVKETSVSCCFCHETDTSNRNMDYYKQDNMSVRKTSTISSQHSKDDYK